jgi:hypothetical protein
MEKKTELFELIIQDVTPAEFLARCLLFKEHVREELPRGKGGVSKAKTI